MTERAKLAGCLLDLLQPNLLQLGGPGRAAIAIALAFWPIFIFAGAAAWLIHNRRSLGNQIALVRVVPLKNACGPLNETVLVTAPHTSPRDTATPATTPASIPATTPALADMAAPPRRVATTFPVAETSSPQDSALCSLDIDCQPIRFTLSLGRAALRYRLRLDNFGATAIGPLIIRGDLVAAEPGIPQPGGVECNPDALPVCHYLDSLDAGSSTEMNGELRLPLAGIAAIRLGRAEFLVPLMRLWVESLADSVPALSLSTCFAIGVPTTSELGGIQPFHLDSGLGIWRSLIARRLEGGRIN